MKLFTKHNLLFTLYFYVDNLFWYFPLYYVSNVSVLYMVANSTSLAYICKYCTVNYVTHSPGGECSIYVIVLDTSHRLYSVLLTAYWWTKLSINIIYHSCRMIVPAVEFYFITGKLYCDVRPRIDVFLYFMPTPLLSIWNTFLLIEKWIKKEKVKNLYFY